MLLVEKRGCFFGLFDVHDVAMSEREIISREYTSLAVDFLHISTSFLQSKRNKIKKDFQQFKLIVAYFASINQNK